MRNAVLFAFALASLSLFAQTTIPHGAEVSGVWTVDGAPYYIEGEAVVPEGDTLRIEPDVTLIFAHYTAENANLRGRLRVRGTLIANGADGSEISFIKEYTHPIENYYWGALSFENTQSEANLLSNCYFHGAARFYMDDLGYSIFGGVALDNSFVNIDSCLFDFTGAYNIVLHHASTVNMRECEFRDAFYSGVYADSASVVNADQCFIYGADDSGVYLDSGATGALTNCEISGNNHMGVRLVNGAQAVISNCHIHQNFLSGVQAISFSSVTIDSCLIEWHNQYPGVRIVSSNAQVTGCQLSHNSDGVSAQNECALTVAGCAIDHTADCGLYLYGPVEASIDSCAFTEGYNCGLRILTGASARISRCDISDNEGEGGFISASRLYMENSQVSRNGGTGLRFAGGEDPSRLVGCVIADNCRDTTGVEIMCDVGAHLNVTNSVAHAINSDTSLYVRDASNVHATNSALNNCLITAADGVYTLRYSLVDNAIPPEYDLGHNIVGEDPMFANPPLTDFSLLEGSPCIDAGAPDTTGLHLPLLDILGNVRVYNDMVDMGACEYYVASTPSEIPHPSLGLSLYPNPFNPSLTCRFSLPSPSRVRIDVYDIRGRRAAILADERMLAGEHAVRWNGRDDKGSPASSGVYLIRLRADGVDAVQRAVLLK